MALSSDIPIVERSTSRYMRLEDEDNMFREWDMFLDMFGSANHSLLPLVHFLRDSPCLVSLDSWFRIDLYETCVN